uniref:PNPLA domain-containing protein n=1 Tax=Esox lucius TaxID=8010 RepID=A0A6Q2XLL3_ESOLU
MSLSWAPDRCVLRISRAVKVWQGRHSASFPLRHACQIHVRPSHSRKVGHLGWKSVQTPKSRSRGKQWLCRASQVRHRLGLHTGAGSYASSSRWSAGLSHTMSRFRSTLDSVSKAVSGTHAELLSKIARLRAQPKQKAIEAGRTVDTVPETGLTLPGPGAAGPPAPTSTPAPAPVPAATASTPPPLASPAPPAPPPGTTPGMTPSSPPVAAPTAHPSSSGAAVSEPRLKRVQRAAKAPAAPASGVVNGTAGRGEQSVKPPTAAKTTTTAVSKQTAPLFHPGSLSANLDETYNYLAQHINSYFGATQHHGKKAENASNGAISTHRLPVSGKMTAVPAFAATPPSAQSSPKKGFGRYLSYSGDTVQAFVGSVGSYIAPLVPRFSRASAATGTPEVESEEATEKMDPKASEERAKRLQLQREKIIARVSVDNRTRALVKSLQRASEVRVYVNRVEELGYHLLEFPETRGVAVKEKVIPCLLRLRQAEDLSLKAAVREALTLVGYSNPVKGWGIRVLSIDGGGTRGLIALQTLQKLEALTGKPIHELFDYICGVSTGSILGFMLGLFQIPLNECEVLYRKLGSDVFKQNVIVGTVKMGWNHAFYDSETWENILKEKMGADLMVETSRNPNCPKVAAVSTIVNRGTPLKAYVFRNYNLQPGVRSHYLGGCEHQLWQAVRASSAAPGYFQEFALGNDLHQDGGLLINNPTALAIHECKCLWPDTPVQCVVSLGTGRVETAGKNNTTYTSLKTKLTNVISSATDTEEVHVMLDALLPPDTYFRFNPYMNEDIALDESRGEKLNLLQAEGLRYLDRNQEKLQKAARILAQGKSPAQRLADWAKLKADMYDGIPGFSSKL